MPLPKFYTISLFVSCCLLLTCCLACDNDIDRSNNNSVHSSQDLGGSNSFLCRLCGLSIGDESIFVDITSPFSKSDKNETVHYIVDGKVVSTKLIVQKLENPAGVVFDVITVRQSSCEGAGKVLLVLLSVWLSPKKLR